MSNVVKRKVWARELVDLTDQDLAVLRHALERAVDRSVLMYKQQTSSVPVPATEAITDALNGAQRAVARVLLSDVCKLEKKLGRRR